MPKLQKYKGILEDALEEIHGKVTDLGEELREWFDNSPEGLQNSDKMQRVSDAADTLEGLEKPEVPEAFAQRVVTYQWYTTKAKPSRVDRLTTLSVFLDYIANTLEEDDDEERELREAIEAYKDELESIDIS